MMADQGRYDREHGRGSDYDDGRSARGDRSRESGEGRRSDALFGSGWSEREERGWGSSGVRDRSGDSERSRSAGGGSGGGSWFGGSRDRDDGDRSRGAGSSSDRDHGGRSSRSGSWFGGGGAERDHRGRERNWEPVAIPSRDDVRGRSDHDKPERDRLERERIEHERVERERSERDRRGPEDRDRDRGDRDRMARERTDRERMDRERMDRERLDRERMEHEGQDGDHRERGRSAGAVGAAAAGRERGYGSDDQRGGMPIDETGRLIASNKVEGTAVFGLDGERLGSIYNFMVEKHSGQVEYAVMTYGGFLGMGTRYYPLPWQLLKYDTRRGGYRIDLTTRDLERAPSFDRSNEPEFDRSYDDRVHGWYGVNR